MICDSTFLRRYGLGMIRPRSLRISQYLKSGYLKLAPTPEALAEKIGLPGAELSQTVARANRFAQTGKDEDFGRGETIYDRSNGDPAHGPNPCLGPIARAPFYAVELHPTPLGSSRGLTADTQARVLGTDGTPVTGLYVCGNDMQSAFAGEYPGRGRATWTGNDIRLDRGASRRLGQSVNRETGEEKGRRNHRRNAHSRRDRPYLWNLWTRKRGTSGPALRCARPNQAGFAPARAGGGSHGGWILPRVAPTGGDADVDRAGIGQPDHGAGRGADRQLRDLFDDRECADIPVQPRAVPGTEHAPPR